jgi:hypothetical protein
LKKPLKVAVFGVLAKGRFATAIDTRLYLPKEWTDDAQRCNKAAIPKSERVFKTKNQLALEIVEQARRNGVRFGWVGADAGYGQWSGLSLCFGGCRPLLPDRCSQELRHLWVDPQPKPGPSTKGRIPNRSTREQDTLSVQQFVQGCPTKDWTVYNVRETTRGLLKLRVLRKSVYVWDKHSGKGRRYELLVTESFDGQDRKYSLTNQKPSTSTRRLARRSLKSTTARSKPLKIAKGSKEPRPCWLPRARNSLPRVRAAQNCQRLAALAASNDYGGVCF